MEDMDFESVVKIIPSSKPPGRPKGSKNTAKPKASAKTKEASGTTIKPRNVCMKAVTKLRETDVFVELAKKNDVIKGIAMINYIINIVVGYFLTENDPIEFDSETKQSSLENDESLHSFANTFDKIKDDKKYRETINQTYTYISYLIDMMFNDEIPDDKIAEDDLLAMRSLYALTMSIPLLLSYIPTKKTQTTQTKTLTHEIKTVIPPKTLVSIIPTVTQQTKSNEQIDAPIITEAFEKTQKQPLITTLEEKDKPVIGVRPRPPILPTGIKVHHKLTPVSTTPAPTNFDEYES